MIKAFKGFTRDLKCRGFQFKEGETFEVQGEPKLCEHGFHACEDPVDCFSYYAPSESEYHEVELEDVSPERKEDSKVVAKRIKIGAKLSLKDMIAASIALRFSKTTVEPGAHTDKERCSVSATGYKGAASATGDNGAASATGDKGAASATGYNGAAIASGEYGAAVVSGKDSVAVSLGYNGAAKGALGDWIVLTEREKKWNEKEFRYDYPIKEVKSFFVDGENIKADTFYKLVDGEAVPANW